MSHKPPDVVFADTSQGLDRAVDRVLDPFGGPAGLLKSSRDVYIKVNAVDSRAHAFTDPELIRSVIRAFFQAGARNVYVIENCTQGNFTRLVFAATGIFRVCRQTGARAVCLDETPAAPVYLPGLESFVDISSFVYERLVKDRDRNLYVSLPRLKTHSMTRVTLGIKNQFGFVHQKDRIPDHNFRLHQKLADLYTVVSPDFVIVDGQEATTHGHYIAESLADRCVLPADVLIAGPDALAVDTAAAAFLGYDAADVPHLALALSAAGASFGVDDLDMAGRDLFDARRMQLTHELVGAFPEDLTILRGAERCCPEGCRCNTETVVEMLAADYGGKGGFAILMGKGIDPAAVAEIQGPVHLAGSCAVMDWEVELTRRLGPDKVTTSRGCNNLSDTVVGLCRHMKVHPVRLTQASVPTALSCLVQARLHRSRALIPSLL